MAPFLAEAQFKLTSSGFISSTDTTKNYIVIEAPDATQADLYKKTLLYLSSLYVSPKDVISVIENESITINAVSERAIKMKVLYLNPSWDVNYTINFLFKDGRIRMSQPSINNLSTRTGDVYRTASVSGGNGSNHKEIYNKKGVLKEKDGKENLELFINNYVSGITKNTLSSQQEEW